MPTEDDRMGDVQMLSVNHYLAFGIIWFLLGGMLTTAHAQPNTSTPIETYMEHQVNRHSLPGVAVAAIQDGNVIHLAGYGDLTSDTPVYIASLSKSFTALAVMQLVEAGQLDLDASVTTYLPGFTTADPAHTTQITLRNLLHHRSGLSETGYPVAERASGPSLAEQVAGLANAQPIAEVDAAFYYFNQNYDVLGHVVEVVSGESYETYVTMHILQPLGMTDTRFSMPEPPTQGHVLPFGFPVPYREALADVPAASGGMVSTASDLAAYLRFHVTGEMAVLSPDLIRQMHTPPAGRTYAMGWYTLDLPDGTRVVTHGGDLTTFRADMVLMPEDNAAFAVLYNSNHIAAGPLVFQPIVAGLADIIRGEAAQPSGIPGWLAGATAFVAVAALVLLDLARLVYLPAWGRKNVHKAWWRLLPGFALELVPLVILLYFPTVMGWLSGRSFSLGVVFPLLPEPIILLIGGALLSIPIVVGRIVLLARH
ncbi:MAG: serine hydrolase domain-containing protein [Chloroflexota bacterium]